MIPIELQGSLGTPGRITTEDSPSDEPIGKNGFLVKINGVNHRLLVVGEVTQNGDMMNLRKYFNQSSSGWVPVSGCHAPGTTFTEELDVNWLLARPLYVVITVKQCRKLELTEKLEIGDFFSSEASPTSLNQQRGHEGKTVEGFKLQFGKKFEIYRPI